MNTLIFYGLRRQIMPKVSLDMPAQILEDLKLHVGDDGKFVSVADAIRTACRKMLDVAEWRVQNDN